MQKLLTFAFLALGVIQAPPPNDNGSVAGTVVLVGRSEPLAGAEVLLTPNGRPPAGSKPLELRAVSDREGHFLIRDVPPGLYAIIPKAEGFMKSMSDFTPDSVNITILPKQDIRDFAIVMARETVVAGKVTDANGGPAANAGIEVQTPDGTSIMRAKTDEKGQFRLVVPPVQMVINANYMPLPSNPPQLDESYAKTYYPGVIDIRSATRLDMREGDTNSGLDFRLQRSARVRVSGSVVVDPSLTGVFEGSIYLEPSGSRPRSGFDRSPRVSVNTNLDDGLRPQFEFRDVQPGGYTLYAVSLSDNRTSTLGRTTIEVDKQDVNNVIVKMTAGIAVKGHFTTNIILGPNSPMMTPSLQPDEASLPSIVKSALRFGEIDLDSNGGFTIANVPEGEYVVHASNLPPGAALLEVHEGGRLLVNNVIMISNRTPDPLILTVGLGGIVQGNVIDEDRKPVRKAGVTLVPDRERRRDIRLFQTTSTDANGDFVLVGVPPGNYTLFAFEIRPTPDVSIPAILERFESKGTPVSVTPGGSVTSTVVSIRNP